MGNKSELTLAFLLIAALCLKALIIDKTFYYPSKNMTWPEARLYCQKNHIDLVTLNKVDRLWLAKWLLQIGVQKIWIGLLRDPERDSVWKWIDERTGEGISGNWRGDCGSFDPVTEQLQGNQCSEELQLVCYDDNLVVVKQKKTWEEALGYCRSMQTPCTDSQENCMYRHQLLSLTHEYDYNYVRERIYTAKTDEVWTGLRFLEGEWWWVNGQVLDHQGMLPDCPSQWKHCGTLSKQDINNWLTRDCSERRNFVCYRHKVLLAEEDQTIS